MPLGRLLSPENVLSASRAGMCVFCGVAAEHLVWLGCPTHTLRKRTMSRTGIHRLLLIIVPSHVGLDSIKRCSRQTQHPDAELVETLLATSLQRDRLGAVKNKTSERLAHLAPGKLAKSGQTI